MSRSRECMLEAEISILICTVPGRLRERNTHVRTHAHTRTQLFIQVQVRTAHTHILTPAHSVILFTESKRCLILDILIFNV